jgi:hypothetical protein
MSKFERFEYSVTSRSPALAWKIFADRKLWPEFSDNYKENPLV